jgi:hypothetical protein
MSTEYTFDSLAEQQLSHHYLELETCEARFHASVQAVQAEDVVAEFVETLDPATLEPWVDSIRDDRPLPAAEREQLFWMLQSCLEQAFEQCRRREAGRLSVED